MCAVDHIRVEMSMRRALCQVLQTSTFHTGSLAIAAMELDPAFAISDAEPMLDVADASSCAPEVSTSIVFPFPTQHLRRQDSLVASELFHFYTLATPCTLPRIPAEC